MTVQEIATQLVNYCRNAEWEKAQQELYADDAVSIEPYGTPEFAKETKGKKGILEKGRKFTEMTETMHSIHITDPVIAENAFSIRMEMDITTKGRGRMNTSEICVYVTKDGKIISEQFFV